MTNPFVNYVLFVARRKPVGARNRGRDMEKASKMLFFRIFSVSSVISVAKGFDITREFERRPL